MRYSSMYLAAVLGGLTALSPLASAGTLQVPGTYPTIQLAIDAANPGDVIEVAGGTYGPITIDKPLTILETAPGVVIDNTVSFPANTWIPPAINLDGPGSGSVILSGIDIQGTADGFQ